MKRQITNAWRVLIICAVCATSSQGQAQHVKKQLPIQVITKQTESETLLRWAFDSPSDWYHNKDMSFDIYRAPLADGATKTYTLIAENITVASKSDLESRLDADPSNVGVGAILQANYGEWLSQGQGKKQYGILDKKDELDSKYMILLYACDINWNTAEMAGLGYADKTTKYDKDYIYRLAPSDTTYLQKHIIAQKDKSPALIISDWAENENQIVFGWNRHRYENAYTGFYIEKSKDGKKYQRQNKAPYVHLESEDYEELPLILWQDSVANYRPEYYRIIGVDAFGKESAPSDAVRLQGRDRTPPAAPTAEVALSPDQSHVSIHWKPNIQDDVDAYVIRKTYKADGPYKEVARLAKTVFAAEDAEVDILNKSYYQVCAADTAGNYGCSPPLYLVIDDQIAPDAPHHLAGTIDSNGVVTLTWDRGTEVDLWGYYVQVSNGTKRVFTSVTPKVVQTNTWKDTIPLNVLTEDIYYRINAVDLRSNTSQFSKIIKLKKPDMVPPNASLFGGYEVLDSSIRLDIIYSSSKDVETVALQRRMPGSDFTTIHHLQNRQTSIEDIDIRPSALYTYRLITTDDGGNMTVSPSDLTVSSQNILPSTPIQLSATQSDGIATLTWSPLSASPQFIKLYKGPPQDLKPVKTINGQADNHKINITEEESYRVRVFYQDGSKSPYSNVVKLSSQ